MSDNKKYYVKKPHFSPFKHGSTWKYFKTQEICLSRCNSKVFALFLISWFVHICHIDIFHIIKQILMSDKDNLSKYNMQFLKDDF